VGFTLGTMGSKNRVKTIPKQYSGQFDFKGVLDDQMMSNLSDS